MHSNNAKGVMIKGVNKKNEESFRFFKKIIFQMEVLKISK